MDCDEIICNSESRKDDRNVAFKKLEKVGNPYVYNGTTCQLYKSPIPIYATSSDYKIVRYDMIEVAIKQNQEDMEENKMNLKPFDLEAARSGKPVRTRDGRKARIICFDAKGTHPIIALVSDPDIEGEEIPFCYTNDGFYNNPNFESYHDLMLLPEKKEGWVNVYKRENEYICENECSVSTGITVYKIESEAKRNIDKNRIYVNTIKINWEG